MDDIIEALDQASTLWEWAAARALRRIPPSPLLDSLNPYGRPLPRSMPAVTQRIPAAVIAAATRLGDGLAAARPGGDMLTGFGLDPAATKQLFDIAYEAAIGVRRNVSELALRRSLGAAVSESLVYAAVVRTMVANALQLAYQHFMRHVLPPPRDGNACFVFDDENVFRWTGYSTFVAKHVHAIVSVDFGFTIPFSKKGMIVEVDLGRAEAARRFLVRVTRQRWGVQSAGDMSVGIIGPELDDTLAVAGHPRQRI